jgi:hypothetical protein
MFNPTAEGAIHPETLRQKDRLCNELWRAALIIRRPPMGQRDRDVVVRHDNLSGIKDRGVNSKRLLRVRPFFVSGTRFITFKSRD